MQKLSKQFLCLSLALPFQVMVANTSTQPSVHMQDKLHFVYLSTQMRCAVECLNRMLPDHQWSPEFKHICDRIAKDGIAGPYAEAVAVVVECLNLLDGNNCAELQEAKNAINQYAEELRKGDANIVLIEDAMTRACSSCTNDCNNKCIKYKKTKAFCNLFAQDLQVPGSGYIANLTSNQFRVTGDAVISGNLIVDGEIFTDEQINFENLVVDNLTVNGTFTTNGPVNMGTDATADTINIGTAGAGRIVNIGNDLAGSITTITGDTSQLILGNPANSANLSATGAVNIDGTTTLDLNASAGPVNIANDNVTQTVNIGTGSPLVKTINVGTGAGANVITAGSATAASITENALTMNYGTSTVAQTLNFGTGTTGSKTIHIGDGAATVNTITIGNTTTGTGLSLNGGLNAGVSVSGTTHGPISGTTDTLDDRVGSVSFTGNTIGAGLAVQFNISNSTATTTSRILATLSWTTTGGSAVIYHLNEAFVPANGTVRFVVQNIGTTPGVNTDVLTFTFWVLN